MAITPMNHTVEIIWRDFISHSLRNEWHNIPLSHPTYGSPGSFLLFLKQEHNINIFNINHDNDEDIVHIEFKSEQDYTLWKLLQ